MTDSPLRITGDYSLSTHGSTRGTAYTMSNKVVRRGNTLFLAWLDSPGMCMINSLDLATGKLGEAVQLGQTDVRDNHCGPALAATSNGHLHVIVGAHNRPFRYRRSVRPWDIREWTDEPPFPPDATYPSLVVGPDDTLYLTARAYFPRGESPKLIFRRRRPGERWTEARAIARTPSPTGYVHYGNTLFLDRDGTLHLSFHFYHGDPPESIFQGYLQSPDGGDTWTRSDGTAVELPATFDTVEKVVVDPSQSFRGHGIAEDPEGRITIAADTREGGIGGLFRLEGPGRWRKIDLLPILDRYCPGLRSPQEACLTFDRNGDFYVSLDVKPVDEPWGSPQTKILLLHSTDCGETFTGLLVAEPNDERPTSLCSLERVFSPNPIDGPPALLYTRGVRGKGCTPSDLTDIHLVTFEKRTT